MLQGTQIVMKKNEMQSNAKHKFECFKGQGEGRMANQDRFDKGINMELDRQQHRFDTQKKSLKYYYSQRLWDPRQNIESETR